MHYAPTYHTLVDNRPIWVFDDICTLSEIKHLYSGLDNSAYKRNEVARPDTQEHKHWAVNLAEPQILALPLYQKLIAAVNQVTEAQYQAYRGYCNHAAFGDMLFTHTDCLPSSNEMTALVYVAPEWDIEWGGETLFFNKNDDCAFACTPKPGRVVLFHGAIKHVGRPPNRICYKPRFTLAFKLEPASNR
ncbi:2OG-Fe(II) oxygenase [Alteromonas oceanisediminis]|uniref:2OG-Fe(II) oxygenase n=1 Tax=Alteromonas oceanisediminis TaxID=2836180 RepID=UPI001BDADC1E|nr:2OG-Fe(II) oxygenase [Alteromonas oceanisediminis]MBT0584858.1 2OG-Fe(II) oxygenase [Alteromonas oceanisediminis]